MNFVSFPRNNLAGEIGSGIYFGGIVDETSAGVNPAQYVAGLGKPALRSGAGIYENTRVHENRTQFAKTDRRDSRNCNFPRQYFCAKILVATSGYTSGAHSGPSEKNYPHRLVHYRHRTAARTLARELSPRNRMIYDSKHYLYYYRLTPDNRMLFGGRAAFFPETKNTIHRSAEILQKRHDRSLPAVTEYEDRTRLGRYS